MVPHSEKSCFHHVRCRCHHADYRSVDGGGVMKCPICNSKMRVTDSRDGYKVTRKRECPDCLTRFETIEVVVMDRLPKYLRHKAYEAMKGEVIK